MITHLDRISVTQTWNNAAVLQPEPGREVVCLAPADSSGEAFDVLAPMYYLVKGSVLWVEYDRNSKEGDQQHITETGFYVFEPSGLRGLVRYRLIDDIAFWMYPIMPDGNELKQYAFIISEDELHKRKCKEIEICVALLLDKRLDELDRKLISRWVELYGVTEELVDYAIRSYGWWGNVRTVDIDKKLHAWYEAGVMSIDEAKQYDEKGLKRHTERYKERIKAKSHLDDEKDD